jgi:hypothetical protein
MATPINWHQNVQHVTRVTCSKVLQLSVLWALLHVFFEAQQWCHTTVVCRIKATWGTARTAAALASTCWMTFVVGWCASENHPRGTAWHATVIDGDTLNGIQHGMQQLPVFSDTCIVWLAMACCFLGGSL